MRRAITTFGVTLIFGTVAGVAMFGNAWSQPGTVLTHKKIDSDTIAAFGAPLNDGDEFGDAVCNLGDLDGPGPAVAAVAVGSIGDDDGGSHHGAVYVLFLNAASNVLSYRKISSTQGGFTGVLDGSDEFGGAVANLGDLDGPGPSVTALAVGAVGDDDGGTDRGAVWVLFLDSSGSVLSHQKISNTEGNFTAVLDDLDEFGGALAGLGDLDGIGPGAGTLAVGAIGDDDGGPHRGSAYVLFLGSTGSVLAHRKISDTEGDFTAPLRDNDDFGEDLASLGDLDGSGPSACALAVSAISDDDGGRDRGAVYVLFLTGSGSVLHYQKISNIQGNFAGPLVDSDNWGSAIVGLGDLDGPGPSAVAMAASATGDDGPGLDRGAVYILFLDATGNCLSYQEISSTAGGLTAKINDTDEFGGALAALGDIDNGEAQQALVSAVSFDDGGGADRGAVFVLSLEGTAVLAVDDSPNGIRRDGMSHARPNPFKRGTTIPFRINEAGRVGIDIWDVRGRLVRRLVQGPAAAGEHHVSWDGFDDSGRRLAPGTYFLRMSFNGKTLTTVAKAVLLR